MVVSWRIWCSVGVLARFGNGRVAAPVQHSTLNSDAVLASQQRTGLQQADRAR